MPSNIMWAFRILIGADNVKGQEVRRIVKINGNTLTFAQPLKNAHPVKDIVTVEYVRQRFWVDADVGSVFWHDHAFGGTTWPHGAVGTMIAEPFGSTWHDPKTGKRIRSGPVADIHAVERVGHDVAGSFRELMVHIHGYGAAHGEYRDGRQSSRATGGCGLGSRSDGVVHYAAERQNQNDAHAVFEWWHAYDRWGVEFPGRAVRTTIGQ